MIYLDTNVFAYAIANDGKYGSPCKRILLAVEKGKLEAVCSMLVLVELQSVLRKFNKLRKREGHSPYDVPANVDAVLSYPITWLDIDFLTVKRAAEYAYNIAGPDCVHVASMELAGVSRIISADAEFDKAEIVRRTDPLDFKP